MLEDDSFTLKIGTRENAEEKGVAGGVSSAIFETAFFLEDSKRQLRPQDFRTQTLKFALAHVYTSLCLLSFLNVTPWTQALPYFWGLLLWFRVDYVANQLTYASLYVVWGIIMLHGGMLAFVVWKSANHDTEKLGGFLRSLPLLNSTVLTGLDVSISSILLPLGLQVLLRLTPTRLCPFLDSTPWKTSLSLSVFVLFLLFQSFREFKNTYYEHSRTATEIGARATAYIDLLRLLCTHLIEISYYSVSPDYPTLHLTITLVVGAGVVLAYYRRVPYYNAVANAILAGNFTFVSTSAVVVIWADLIGSPLFSALGMLFFAPTIGGLVFYHYKWYYYPFILNYYQARLHKSSIQTFQAELGLRSDLQHPKLGQTAIEIVGKVLSQYRLMSTKRPKMVLLWAVDYSLKVMENEQLARLKLAQSMFAERDFEADFVEMRYDRYLSSRKSIDPVEYLKYFQRMRKVRRMDLILCHCLADFYSQLASKSPDSKKICKCTKVIDSHVRFLKGEYKALIKDFPKTKESSHLFASFLEDVLRIYDKANIIRVKANVFSYSERRLEYADYDSKVSFFQKGCGIVFVSAGSGDMGTIVYANDLAHMALGYYNGTLPGTFLSSLIPAPYRPRHYNKLREFLHSSVTLDHKHPSVLYFSDASGFIVECVTNITVTAASGPPMFLISFKPTETFKEVCFLTNSNVISACSKEFGMRIGHISSSSIVGMRLDHANPAIAMLACGEPFEAHHFLGGNESFCVFSTMKVGNVSMKLLFIIDTEEEANYWAAYSKDVAMGNTNSVLWKGSGGPLSPGGSDISMLESALSSQLLVPRTDMRRSSVLSVLEPNKRQRKLVQFSPTDTEITPPPRGNKKEFSISLMSAGGLSGSVSCSNSSMAIASDGGVKLIADTNLSFRILKYVTLLTVPPTQILILVLGNCIIGSFLSQVVNAVINSDRTHDYVMRALHIMRMAQNARYIDFANRGIVSQEYIDMYLEIMQTAAEDCLDIQRRLMSDLPPLEVGETIYIWELLDGEIRSHRVNLATAVQNMIDTVRRT